MEKWKPAREATKPCQAQHRACERCLDPVYACLCLPLDLEEYEAPEVVWLAYRQPEKDSPITKKSKHRYEKACREVKRLNRLHAGKIQHFLLPVS